MSLPGSWGWSHSQRLHLTESLSQLFTRLQDLSLEKTEYISPPTDVGPDYASDLGQWNNTGFAMSQGFNRAGACQLVTPMMRHGNMSWRSCRKQGECGGTWADPNAVKSLEPSPADQQSETEKIYIHIYARKVNIYGHGPPRFEMVWNTALLWDD